MSQVEEVVVTRHEFDELSDKVNGVIERVDRLEIKVDEGFIEAKKSRHRTEAQFLEVRRELAHHSELLTMLIQGQNELRQDNAELRRDNAELRGDNAELRQGQEETRNMVKQILEIISQK